MTAEPTVDRRGVASHWKTAGLLAGGLAVGYALVQERERVAGAVTNLQDTLTNDGLTLMHKLSEMADAFLAKVHETFVAAAPPKNLEAAVRHGLIGQSEDAVIPQERPRASRTRLRENDINTDDATTDDPAYQPEASHRRRRSRHAGPERNVAPPGHCSSRAAGVAARTGWQASLQVQEAAEDDLIGVGPGDDMAVAMNTMESDVVEATAESPLPKPTEPDDTPKATALAVNGGHAQDAFGTLSSAQTTTIAQRAQVEPASLLGARLSATWVNETFTCEVMMIREGKRGRFEALVKYEADGVEQWEVIGEPPYKHTLIAEPADTWLRTGSALIGAHTLERIDSRDFEGVVMAWLPKRDGYDSLYKIYHIEDGDFEELDDREVQAAISLFIEGTSGIITTHKDTHTQ